MDSLVVQGKIKEKLVLSKARLREELDLYRKKHNNISLNSIAIIANINNKTIYSWYDGTFKTPVKIETVSKLAELLKINPLYLLGESDRRIANNEDIDLKALVGDYGLLGLRELQNSIDDYKGELSDYFCFNDFEYADIIEHIIGDVTFWRTLMYEAGKIIRLQTNEATQNEFERYINKDSSSDNIIDNPTRIDYTDLIHQVNAKALNSIFDEYIELKKQELNLTEKIFEERVPSPILNIKTDGNAQKFIPNIDVSELSKSTSSDYPIGAILTISNQEEIPIYLQNYEWKFIKTVGTHKYYERIS